MIVKRDCIYSPKGRNRPLHIYLPEDPALCKSDTEPLQKMRTKHSLRPQIIYLPA